MGYALQIAPTDTYKHHVDVEHSILRDGILEVCTVSQLVITSKKSGIVKAYLFMPSWEPGESIDNAQWENGKKRAEVRCANREPTFDKQLGRYQSIADELCGFDLDKTCAMVEHIGIDRSTVEKYNLQYIPMNAWENIEKRLRKAGVLQTSYHADFFEIVGGKLRPRFKGDIILAPHLDADGNVRSFLVIPLDKEVIPKLSPSRYCASLLKSGINMALSIDPTGTLYGENHALKADKKKLLLCSDYVSLLKMDSLANEDALLGEYGLLSLSSTLGVRSRALRSAMGLDVSEKTFRKESADLDEITILFDTRLPSVYDILQPYDGVKGCYRDLADLHQRISEIQATKRRIASKNDEELSPLIVSVVESEQTFAEHSTQCRKDRIPSSHPLQGKEEITELLSSKFGSTQHTEFVAPFFELLNTLDLFAASGFGSDIPGYPDRQVFVNAMRKKFRKLRKFYLREHGAFWESLDILIQRRYSLPENTTLEQFVNNKVYDPKSKKIIPRYNTSTATLVDISRQTEEYFEEVLRR